MYVISGKKYNSECECNATNSAHIKLTGMAVA